MIARTVTINMRKKSRSVRGSIDSEAAREIQDMIATPHEANDEVLHELQRVFRAVLSTFEELNVEPKIAMGVVTTIAVMLLTPPNASLQEASQNCVKFYQDLAKRVRGRCTN